MLLTVTEMRERIEELMKKLGDIRALAGNEKRELTDEEKQSCNSYMDSIEKLERDIELELRVQNTKKRLEEPVEKVEKTSLSPVVQIVKDEQDKIDRFATFGEQLIAIRNASIPGGTVDRRLTTRAATGLSEGVSSEGGFLVQTDFSNQILKNVWETGQIASRVNRITISGGANSLKINGIDETSRVDGSRAGGIRGYWLAEADEKTASKPKFRQIELALNKVVCLCYATDELLDDAAALENVITAGFSDELNFKLQDSIINGTGAGQPLGILNAGCVVSVGAESGQAAATIVYENIVKMYARLLATSMNNAIWIINQDCMPQLQLMGLSVGTGGSAVYLPPGGASAAPYGTLMGRPVIPIEQCQTLGTTGDIMLCDFSNYIMITKGGIAQDVSMHVRFIYDESVFRAVMRVDGQPVLASAITPFKGSNTLSHFVKLDTRS